MAKYDKFEDLPAWQEAAGCTTASRSSGTPAPHYHPASATNWTARALSVSNNIAEGFERVTTNELLAFLAIARGSAGEVRSMMAVVKDRPKLKPLAQQL